MFKWRQGKKGEREWYKICDGLEFSRTVYTSHKFTSVMNPKDNQKKGLFRHTVAETHRRKIFKSIFEEE